MTEGGETIYEDDFSEGLAGARTLSRSMSRIDQTVGHSESSSLGKEENSVGSGSSDDKTALQGSPIQTGPPDKVGFFHHDLAKVRLQTFGKFLMTYVIMGCLMLGVFSIYWGSMYHREKRLVNLKIWIIDQDTPDATSGLQPLIGQTLVDTVSSLSEYDSKLAGWQVNSAYQDSSYGDIHHAITHNKAWATILVQKNATQALYNAMVNADDSFTTENLITAIFYEARDISAVYNYILPALRAFEREFLSHVSSEIYAPLLANLTQSQLSNVVTSAPNVITNPLQFTERNLIRYPLLILEAPMSIGLIYLIIVSFFQFNFFMPVHQAIAVRVKPKHYVYYRIVSSQLSYFILSLMYSLVSLAFQINTGETFGRSGFLVYWSINYLGMSAVGGASENVALVAFATYPPALGFWLLFWVISNTSPTFAPIALCPQFYRYGYAWPIHNVYEALKVVLLNTEKYQIGRNVGILVAWMGVNTALLPLALMFFGKRMAKKAQAGGK